MLFFNLFGCLNIYLFKVTRIQISFLLILAIASIVLLFLFGVMGNKRVSFENNQTYNSDIFLDIGKATDRFKNSPIPNEFFWTYIYITSPLANLQQNVNVYKPEPLSVGNTFNLINNEMLFDFISKRFNAIFGTHRKIQYTISDPFNVSTVYSRSYSYLGWIGIILMGVFVLVFPLLYIKLLPKNSLYTLAALAILNTMYMLLFYDNTIRFTGLGFQLIYPFVFEWINTRNLKLSKIIAS